MNTSFRATGVLLLATALGHAQEAVNLDSVAPPPPRRAGDGVRLGDLKFNLFFDAMVSWSKSAGDDDTAAFQFNQQHQSLLLRAATPDGIEVLADVLHPADVFEATIPLRFFAPGLESVPVLGEASVRGGRILVPFGDFEEHPIYGGTVSNSMAVRDIVWSDYGIALNLPWKGSRTELYVVNGVRIHDSVAEFGSDWGEQNQLKGFGARERVEPLPGLFATGSFLYDFLPRLPGDTVRFSAGDRAALAGLDAGYRIGRFSSRLGGAWAWVAYRLATDSTPRRTRYNKSGWYAEGKWSFTDHWAVRLRGGQVDPDSRTVGDDDLTNINVSGIWTKGPVDCRLTWSRNYETHWPGSDGRPGNRHRVLLETFVSL